MKPGSVVFVGTGIEVARHLPSGAVEYLTEADRVFFLADDPLTQTLLRSFNERVESLSRFYELGKARETTYAEIVEHILSAVRAGERVCVAVYGHPGVFSYATHETIRRARLAGYDAFMFPGISAEACIVAELGVDPALGWQSYEATDFLLHRRAIDVTTSLMLWQVGVVGRMDASFGPSLEALKALQERLIELYGAEHTIIVYEASRHVVIDSSVLWATVDDLLKLPLNAMCSVYVPPARGPMIDVAMAKRLGIAIPSLTC